jgi:hypothetical protein
MDQWEKRWVFKNFDLLPLVIYLLASFPFSKIFSMEDDGFETIYFFVIVGGSLSNFQNHYSGLCKGPKSELVIQLISFSNDKDDSKFNTSHIFKSKNYEITSVKSHTFLRAFQQYQDSTLISLNFIVFSSLNFQWKNCTIFNSSYNICQNISKPPWCTLLILGFPTIARVQ